MHEKTHLPFFLACKAQAGLEGGTTPGMCFISKLEFCLVSGFYWVNVSKKGLLASPVRLRRSQRSKGEFERSCDRFLAEYE